MSCSASTKVRSSAAAVAVSNVSKGRSGRIVASVAPVAVPRMTASWLRIAPSGVVRSLTVVAWPFGPGLTVVAGPVAVGLTSGAVVVGLTSGPLVAGLLAVAGAVALGLSSPPVA